MKKTKNLIILIFTFAFVLLIPNLAKAYSDNYYVLETLNVRNANTGEIIGEKYYGDYIDGELNGSYVYFNHNGTSAKIWAKYLVNDHPVSRYIVDTSNARDNKLNIAYSKYKGEVIYSVRLGNYYRFYENGSPKFVHYSLVSNSPVKGGAYVTDTVNVRSVATGNILTKYRIGKYVYGTQIGDYIQFSYNGTNAKLHKSYVKYVVPQTRYIKTTANVYDQYFDKVGQISTGTKILSVRFGDYYRYFDDGAKFVYASNVSDSYVKAPVIPTTSYTSPKLYTLSEFKYKGIIYWNGYKYTYYSQSVLPGPGLRIPGRHVNSDGYVSDGDGYIVLANSAANGTVFPTPFGYLGKVYDKGVYGNHLDVYIK